MKRFSNYLEELGFLGSKADYSLFTYHQHGIYIILLIYVDYILTPGNSEKHLHQLIQSLGSLFAMKDLGPLRYFLGLEVQFHGPNLYSNQIKYALDLLKRVHMESSKPYTSPVATGQKLGPSDGDPLTDATVDRSVVGALQYLTLTRPDLAYAFNQVCHFFASTTLLPLDCGQKNSLIH